MRKPVFDITDQVPHKPGCTATEDGWRHEISDLGSRRIVLSVYRKQRRFRQNNNFLTHGYREADLRLCFRIKKPVFSRRGSNIKDVKKLRVHIFCAFTFCKCLHRLYNDTDDMVLLSIEQGKKNSG